MNDLAQENAMLRDALQAAVDHPFCNNWHEAAVRALETSQRDLAIGTLPTTQNDEEHSKLCESEASRKDIEATNLVDWSLTGKMQYAGTLDIEDETLTGCFIEIDKKQLSDSRYALPVSDDCVILPLDDLSKIIVAHDQWFDCYMLQTKKLGELREKYAAHMTRYARFGEAMWKFITDMGGDFCGDELSDDILPLAQAAGLCSRVIYDPKIHGGNIEADPGNEIWWWGDLPTKGGVA